MRKIVLIGAAGFGLCWREAIDRRDDVSVVGVVEPDDEAREAALAYFGLGEAAGISAASAGLQRFAGELAIDSSPFIYRLSNAQAVWDADMNLLAAKPLGTSAREARSIVNGAAAVGRSVAVAQQMRYFPNLLKLREILQEGIYGRPRRVTLRMALDGRGWRPGMRWRLSLKHPLLFEAGIHHLDLLRWVLDDELQVLDGTEKNPPWSPFLSGAEATLQLLSNLGVEVEYAATFSPEPGQTPVRFDSGWKIEFDNTVVSAANGGLFVGSDEILAPTSEPEPLESLNCQIFNRWVDSLDSGDSVPFSGEDNLKSMTLLDAALARVGTQGKY